jgi:antitoxin ParD1/3/4/toxin ParE1/3/4
VRQRRSNRFILSAEARADLRDISDYIRQENPLAATRVRQELREAMRRLAQMPGIGHVREDLVDIDTALRFWPVYSYVIVYRAETKPLEVVRVLHGARDVQSLLGEQ